MVILNFMSYKDKIWVKKVGQELGHWYQILKKNPGTLISKISLCPTFKILSVIMGCQLSSSQKTREKFVGGETEWITYSKETMSTVRGEDRGEGRGVIQTSLSWIQGSVIRSCSYISQTKASFAASEAGELPRYEIQELMQTVASLSAEVATSTEDWESLRHNDTSLILYTNGRVPEKEHKIKQKMKQSL